MGLIPHLLSSKVTLLLLTVYTVTESIVKITYSYFSRYLIGSSSYNIESQSIIFSV